VTGLILKMLWRFYRSAGHSAWKCKPLSPDRIWTLGLWQNECYLRPGPCEIAPAYHGCPRKCRLTQGFSAG
jgi:hypothetical protein